MKYTLKDGVIEKRGHVITFTLAEVEVHEQKMAQTLRELKAKKEVDEAKIVNIERNHPFVTKLSKKKRFTVALHQDVTVELEAVNAKIKEIEGLLEDYAKEKADILEQLPELKIPELQNTEPQIPEPQNGEDNK